MKMTWTRALIAAGCCTLALGFNACDDDDDEPKADATSATETTAETTAPAETTEPTETVEEVTPVTDQCTNAADGAIIEAANPDPTSVAGRCGLEVCINAPNAEKPACVTECVINGNDNPAIPATNLSAGCAGCYTIAVVCAFQNCVQNGACLDAGSQACADCREDNGCNAAFYGCSGLTPPAN